MDQKAVMQALATVRKEAKQRKFSQSVDLIINFKGLDMKKDRVETVVDLPHMRGKKVTVAGLVGPELLEQASGVLDFELSITDFEEYGKDKKKAKKLAKSYDFFIAQVNAMSKIAQFFGRTFGPLGKMPNPKAGCVLPANGNVKAVYDRLQKRVIVRVLKNPICQLFVGGESMKDEEIAENIITVYKQVVQALPQHENNIGKTFIKLTMSKPVEVA